MADGPPLIAFIAVRTGHGKYLGNTADSDQAIVVGQITVNGAPIWRYALYKLRDLEHMLADSGQHPLDPALISPLLADPNYWPAGNDPPCLLGKEESADLLSDNDLSAASRAYLTERIVPNGIPRLNYAIPLRNVVRMAFYDRANQPTGQNVADGPLMVLDTCRSVDDSPLASTTPLPPAPPQRAEPPFGTSVILFADPAAAPGTLLGVVVMGQMRLALNAHANGDREPRALLRLYALRVAPGRRDPDFFFVPSGKDAADPPPGFGPWFDSMRIGFTTRVWDGKPGARVYSQRKTGQLSSLTEADARARDFVPPLVLGGGGQPLPGQAVPLPDTSPFLPLLAGGFDSSSVTRELGFRVVRDGNTQLALRFEAGYRVTTGLKRPGQQLDFLPDCPAWSAPQWHLFAQEQPLGDLGWSLAPRARTRFVLTARLLQTDQVTETVLAAVADRVTALGAALHQVRDGQPLSMLPVISQRAANQGRIVWHLVGSIIDTRPYDRTLAKEDFWNPKDEACKSGFVALEPRFIGDMWYGESYVTPAAAAMAAKPAAPPRTPMFFNVEARFPCVGLVRGTDILRYQAILTAPQSTSVADTGAPVPQQCLHPCYQPAISALAPETAPRGIFLGLNLQILLSSPAEMQLGALAIGFTDTDAKDQTGPGLVRFETEPGQPAGLAPAQPASIEARLTFPAYGGWPAGQDPTPDAGATTESDLFLRLHPVAPDTGRSLGLVATETAGPRRNQTLGLSLTATGQSVNGLADDALLVIDRAPFRVTLVRVPNLAAAQTAESNEVAVWNAEGGAGPSWRLVDDAGTVSLLLPPQAIGEAMEKNRRSDGGRPPDINEGSPAAARFGASTRLDLSPAAFDTRYVEPGWNLRRMMGYPGQRDPGAVLRDLRLEMAYGLLTRITPDGGTTRIAELAAVIGAPPTPPSTPTDYAERCAALWQAEASRPAVDRLWRGDPLADLVIEQGIRFQLRLPTTDKVSGMTPLRWPVTGDVPSSLPAAIAAGFTTSTDDLASFPGGVSWAFESANLLTGAYRTPQSTDGRISGLHLSALGATGQQRAVFDDKKTIIEVDTAMGRLQRYALERIGRIGALWHRAKHVIVYERSVVPAAQFYNDVQIEQDELLGRAVLRKVEEYVQILQPTRRYPEDGTAIEAAGCVTGASFTSLVIRVDSTWGGDVRAQGWQVPLWNTAFDRPPASPSPDDPSRIYPKPHILFQVMGAGGIESTLEIDEPEKLVFYTSTLDGDGGDDTDGWQAVRDIDFLDLPVPQPANRKPNTADLIDAPMPPAPDHLPGHERLTIGLAASKDMVALAHGRQESGPVAKLRNITIGRAVEAAGDTGSTRALGTGLAQSVSAISVAVDSLIGRVHQGLQRIEADPGMTLDAAAVTTLLQTLTTRKDYAEAIGDIQTTVKGLASAVPPIADQASKITGYLTAAAGTQSAVLQTAIGSIVGGLKARSVAAGDFAAAAYAADAFLPAWIAAQAGLTAGTPAPAVIAAGLNTALQSLLPFSGKVADVTAEGKAVLEQHRVNAVAFADAACVAFGAFDARVAAIAGAIRQLPALACLKPVTATNIAAVQAAAATLARSIGALPAAPNDGQTASLPQEAKRLISGAEAAHYAMDTLAKAICKLSAAAAQTDIDDVNGQLDAVTSLPSCADAIDAFSNRFVMDVTQALASFAALPAVTAANLVAAQDSAQELLAKSAKLPEVAPPGWPSNRRKLLTALSLACNACAGTAGEFAGATAATIPALNAALGGCQAAAQAASAAITRRLSIADAYLAHTPDDLISPVAEALAGYANAARDALDKFDFVELQATQSRLDGWLKGAWDDTATAEFTKIVAPGGNADIVAKAFAEILRGGVPQLGIRLAGLPVPAPALATALSKGLGDSADEIEGFTKRLPQGDDFAALFTSHPSVAGLQAALNNAITAALPNGMQAIQDATAQISQNVNAALGGLASTIHGALSDALGTDPTDALKSGTQIYQQGSDTLRLLRAVGDPPKADLLGFNRPQVAYVFQQANRFVNMTPAISLVNRIGNTAAATGAAAGAADALLTSFGVRLPLSSIGDQLMPDELKGLDVSTLLPDFSGIKLDGLFKNLAFPSLSDSDAVKITHGFDTAQHDAWLQADIDVPFDDPAPLMDFGPVQIMVESARFTSTARISVGAGGSDKRLRGQIAGDWQVVCAGQTVISFMQTALTFDQSGHIGFDIQPDRVELADALQFLTEIMQACQQDGGLQVLPYPEGGLPSGVAARLDMVMPSIQSGAFGISDLSLHVMFAVAALPEFEIVTELGLGSKLAPFTLNITLLNGGGFITSQLRYLPTHRPAPLLAFTLEVGIVAGVGLGFSVGVVSGGVWLQIGCSVALNWSTGGGGSTTALSAFILLRGCVDVAGLITASLNLILEITYDGNTMIGSGALHIRVKISIFYTLSVSEHVQYTFIGAKKAATAKPYSNSFG